MQKQAQVQAMYYAAHKEGTYPTPREALSATRAPSDKIEASLSKSRGDAVLLDFGGYAALATPSQDGKSWDLWRAFTGEATPDRADAEAFINEFPKDLQDKGTWAIFEFVPGHPPVH